MRKTLCALALASSIAALGAAPAMAAGTPERPSGPVVPLAPSDNGGDNGWGNCGHNSSGGNPPAGHGNGGYGVADCSQVPDPTGGGVN